MFNFFRRKISKVEYTLLARYRTGYWFRSFTIPAKSAYEACRKFDTSVSSLRWQRVSEATVAMKF